MDTFEPGTDSPTSDELTSLRAQNEALRSRLVLRTRVRTWLAVLLVVLTALSATLATVAVWTHRTLFDTERFMEVMGPALDDRAFYVALSGFVSDETLEVLDLDTRVTEALARIDLYLSDALIDALEIDARGQAILDRVDRPSLTALAPPITEALESRVTQTVDLFIASDEFRTRLPELVRRSHEVGVALVRNDLTSLPNVYIEDGSVRLNLIPVITDALRRVQAEIRDFLPDITVPDVVSDLAAEGRQQLAEAVKAELPDDFGQLTLMSEQRLDEIQAAAGRLDRFVWGILALTFILAVATIAVAPDRRRTTIHLGLGVAAGLALGWVLLRRIEQVILAEILNPDGEQAVRALLGEILTSLGSAVLLIAVTSVVVALAAYLAGRPAWMQRIAASTAPASGGSDFDRWVAGHHDLLKLTGIGLAVTAVFVIGFEPVAVIVIAGLLALWLWGISAARRRVSATVPTTVIDVGSTASGGESDT
ncbi:MAG: hypothetical protein R6X29_04410 [Acidimicrobiia bacterium]